MSDNVNTISIEQICEIPTKYVIGKRPLSLLLGWGELTLSRYLDGTCKPEKNYEETLRRVYNEPDYYLSILESNKDKISPVAYKKSKDIVQKLLEEKMQDVDYSDMVINNIANDFISKLNGYNFSTSRVQSIVEKINEAVNKSVSNNIIQIGNVSC